MTALKNKLAAARQSGDFNELLAAIPYADFLGMTMALSGEELIGKLAYSEHLIGNSLIPALHGGTTGALLESTSIFTLMMTAETTHMPRTINITIEFLRTGRDRDTFARAEFTKLGRRVANVRSFAWQEDRDKPIAAANAHFLLLP